MYTLQISPAISRDLPRQKPYPAELPYPKKKQSVFRAQRVTEPPDLTCRICWVPFTTKSHWLLHIKYFHFPPSFTCPHCPKAYKYKMDLKNHLRLKHSGKPSEYTCPECSKSYKLLTQLNHHIRTKHTSQAFPCQYCEKIFKEKFRRNHHEALHDEDNDYTCSFCPLRYLFKTGFIKHMESIHPRENIELDERNKSSFLTDLL